MRSDGQVRGIDPAEGLAALERWDLGTVERTEPLAGGSRTSPKWVVTTPRGSFVLKRRAPGRSTEERLAFSHAFVQAAARAGVPVAAPIVSRSGRTHEVLAGAVYELFARVPGHRWTRTPEQAMGAGEALGRLHEVGMRMAWHGPVRAGSFHGSMTVFEALRRAPGAIRAASPDTDERSALGLCETIGMLYREASAQVEDLGFAALGAQVVHGDLHPGNVLFEGDEVRAVIDFDAARLEPAVIDFANSLLQFASRGGHGTAVAAWPAELNENRLNAFTQGYRLHGDAGLEAIVEMVPPLMIEACIAEVSIPVAQRGLFGALPGLDVLALVRRKAQWIQQHAGGVVRRLRASLC